eukprot:scaffold1307_cov200-Pinguiococcus_pyrenoidosus.AAC.107
MPDRRPTFQSARRARQQARPFRARARSLGLGEEMGRFVRLSCAATRQTGATIGAAPDALKYSGCKSVETFSFERRRRGLARLKDGGSGEAVA